MDWLEGLDFVCYLAGNSQKPASEEGSLAQLTGCWSPRLEYKHWSNVVSTAYARAIKVQKSLDGARNWQQETCH